jgi:hypothetical protein
MWQQMNVGSAHLAHVSSVKLINAFTPVLIRADEHAIDGTSIHVRLVHDLTSPRPDIKRRRRRAGKKTRRRGEARTSISLAKFLNCPIPVIRLFDILDECSCLCP